MKILLAIDSSPESQTAVDHVATRPWPAQTSVDVVSVFEPPEMWEVEKGGEQAHQRLTQITSQAVEKLQAAGLEASASVLSGDPRHVILERARQTGAVFAVAGSHGTSRVRQFVLGSVAQTLLRSAPCSVLIVRKAGVAIRKVLVATDGSESSALAVDSVAQRPWPEGTEMRVLSVAELVPSPASLWDTAAPISIENMRAVEREGALRSEDAANQAVEKLKPAFPKVSRAEVVLASRAKVVILEEAEKWGADLIVMGSHGRGGLSRLVIGSVSEAVASHTECSVEVIRPLAK